MNELKFPKHECGLILEHNTHRDYYQKAEEWIKENEELYGFETPEARTRAIATNEIWTLHWYPRTPIGFYAIAAPTLEELLERAARIEKED